MGRFVVNASAVLHLVARNDLDWRPRRESFVAEAEPLFSVWHAAR
jgi:hypothetical protein